MIINKKERITSQKKIILDYLKSTKEHPSANLVLKEVKKKLPQISQGTVYRILNNLKKNEKIRVIDFDGISYFDGNPSLHAHFICQKCQKIFDVFNECSECQIIKRQKLKVGKIQNYQIYFYGYCKKCKRK